jgi:hypothetical protein
MGNVGERSLLDTGELSNPPPTDHSQPSGLSGITAVPGPGSEWQSVARS